MERNSTRTFPSLLPFLLLLLLLQIQTSHQIPSISERSQPSNSEGRVEPRQVQDGGSGNTPSFFRTCQWTGFKTPPKPKKGSKEKVKSQAYSWTQICPSNKVCCVWARGSLKGCPVGRHYGMVTGSCESECEEDEYHCSGGDGPTYSSP
ncbi:hypothetical protein IE53DRAFT_386637 [Violaceomyces palustris]|uniref:Uncharacterized protein n=1 Tax=Violaceomyces palustris TaxID=1673888 RepID=A0ACD0NZ26_9BASI|nr:hypothetical protein IE53DRAFT_386637 [Violaceomyces palustris]